MFNNYGHNSIKFYNYFNRDCGLKDIVVTPKWFEY
jgi:hypothetical protein